MTRLFVGALALVALASVPSSALAQRGTHSLSDAVYVGGRFLPDGAWLVAYDLDILVTHEAGGLTLGPSVSFAFGADGTSELGRHQEWLLTADLLRARWTAYEWHGLRAMLLVGAGMWVASLPEQQSPQRTVTLMDGTSAMVRDAYPAAWKPGAVLTVGVGCDWYWDAHWGLGAYLVGHIRLDDENRMPAFWLELGVGFRWGR
jgi:hypothetical protein